MVSGNEIKSEQELLEMIRKMRTLKAERQALETQRTEITKEVEELNFQILKLTNILNNQF